MCYCTRAVMLCQPSPPNKRMRHHKNVQASSPHVQELTGAWPVGSPLSTKVQIDVFIVQLPVGGIIREGAYSCGLWRRGGGGG